MCRDVVRRYAVKAASRTPAARRAGRVWPSTEARRACLVAIRDDERRRAGFRRQASRTAKEKPMIRKLSSGEYRLYSRKRNPRTGRRRNLGTFKTRQAAEKHEKAVQFFKRRG